MCFGSKRSDYANSHSAVPSGDLHQIVAAIEMATPSRHPDRGVHPSQGASSSVAPSRGSSFGIVRVVWCHLRPDDTDDHSRGVLVMVMSLALRSAFLLNSISMPIARSPGRSRLSTTGEVRRLGRFRGSRCEVGVRGRRRFGPLPIRYNCRCGGRTRMPLLWTRRGAVGW